MRTNHRFLYGFTGYLLATLLLVGTLLSVPLFGATAAELDYSVTKVGFEAAAYSEGGDHMHTTTEVRCTGGRAAVLVGLQDVKSAKGANDVMFYDDAGNPVTYKDGYTYIISMYVKAADPTAGRARFDSLKYSGVGSNGNYAGWANTTQTDNTALADWTFLHIAFDPATPFDGNIVGLLANGVNFGTVAQQTYYIDDVTVVAFKADSVGVAMLDYGDGSDRAFVFGEPGAAIDFPAASADGKFTYSWADAGAQFQTVSDAASSLSNWDKVYKATATPVIPAVSKIDFEEATYTGTPANLTSESGNVRGGERAGAVKVGTGTSYVAESAVGTGVLTEENATYLIAFYAKFWDGKCHRIDLMRGNSWFGFGTPIATEQADENGWYYMQFVSSAVDAPSKAGQEIRLFAGSNTGEAGNDVFFDDVTIVKMMGDEAVLVTVPNNGEARGYAVGAAGSAASLDEPTAPDGQAFDGWCSDAGLTADVAAPTFPNAKTAATLYARYTETTPAEDYTITQIDFENAAYDGADYRVTTDEADAVHGGGKAAKIVGKANVTAAYNSVEGNIDLLDETGAALHFKNGDAYLIGFYVKAEAGYKGNIRIDACKIDASGTHNYQSYGPTVAATGDWQYYTIVWTATTDEAVALFASGNGGIYSDAGVALYIDDVTVVRMSAGFTPAVYEPNNGENRTVSVGKAGDPVALDAPETIPAGKTFAGWYKNVGLSESADGAVYDDAVKVNTCLTLYAKYDAEAAVEGKTVIDYEEGAAFNWVAEGKADKVTKTDNVSVSNEQKHGGSYALRVNGSYADEQPHERFLLTRSLPSGGYADKFGSQTEDRTYFVSFWYYIDAADTVDGFAEFHPTYTNSTTMGSQHNDKLSDETNRLVISTANKGSWQRYTYTVTLPKKEEYKGAWDGALMLEFTTGSPVTGTVKFFIDDVEITRIDDLISAEAIGFSRKGYQLLNDEAFTAAGEKQAVRFVYNLDEVKADVEGRGMHFTVKEMGILTALKSQLPGASAANLTRETAAASANIFDTVISNKRYESDGHTRLFTAYIKNISKDFLQFNVCSRAYVLLTDEASGAEVLVYTEVLDNNVAGLLQAAKSAGSKGYDQSFAWAGIQ